MKLFDKQPDPAKVLAERRNTLAIAIGNLRMTLQNPSLAAHPRYQEAQSLLRQADMVVAPPNQGGTMSADVLEEVRKNLNHIERVLSDSLPGGEIAEPVGTDPALPSGIWHSIQRHFRNM
ncbi:MAG TPA: hypothetical protein VJ246_01155 [Patescibacteria group bacterium]|nr:hypothetical protein [Patescibacteria group bacterium]